MRNLTEDFVSDITLRRVSYILTFSFYGMNSMISLSCTLLNAVPANDSHPLLVGDFTRAAVVLGEVRERMSRDVGGAPDSDIAADGAPGDAGRRFSKPGGAGKEGTSIFSTNTPKRSADPNDTPGGGESNVTLGDVVSWRTAEKIKDEDVERINN